jgi:hypothetical protein
LIISREERVIPPAVAEGAESDQSLATWLLASRRSSLEAAHFFDRIIEGIERGHVHQTMNELRDGLAMLRSGATPHEWRRIAATLRAHPLHALVLKGPITRRAFEKPRGYAGDAALIDLIYRCGPVSRSWRQPHVHANPA